MIKVKDISEYLNEISPYSTKCDWDNCGLLVGDMEKEVKRIGFCLDATEETLASAIENSVDLIITHHPVIFKAQKNFIKGNVAFEAACNGISIISAHTCFDCAEGGVNDVLCEILSIKNAVGVHSDECEIPMARIGTVDEISAEEFAKNVAKKLGTVCRVVNCGNTVKKVAVCGGAGMDFLKDVHREGADAYVTGDVSHHEMLDARAMGITVVAAGHFETEKPAMYALENMVKSKFTGIDTVQLNESNPVEFIG